jgi:hypothetical protein
MTFKSLKEYKAVKKLLIMHPEISVEEINLVCSICEKKYAYDPVIGTCNIRRHLDSLQHKKAAQRKISADSMNEHSNKQELTLQFNNDLILFMTKMNYPISNVDNIFFKEFFNKHFSYPTYSSTYYKEKFLPDIFNEKYKKLREIIGTESFYLIVDSTTNAIGQTILNILIGVCYKTKISDVYLMDCIEMINCTAESYEVCIQASLFSFFGNQLERNKFVLVLTDQAPTMLKVGRLLKTYYNSLKHVTCLAHAMHNVCEKIREKNYLVDEIIIYLKRILIKNKSNKEILRKHTIVKLPKFPILIRWGSWLKFTSFIFDNYLNFSEFIKEIDILTGREYYDKFNSMLFESQIRECRSKLWVTEIIDFLEKKDLSVEDQIYKLEYTLSHLNDISLVAYLNQSLDKNPDISYFRSFNQLRATNYEKIFNYVPLTTVDVERSFSIYRKIFDEQRRSLTIENTRMLIFLYFNKTL